MELGNCEFHKITKNIRTPGQVQTHRKQRIQTHSKEKYSCPPGQPHSQTEHDIHGMEYFHWPAGLSVWLCSLPAPAHLLLAEYEKVGKVPDFLATTENISVINILPILNPKHSSC